MDIVITLLVVILLVITAPLWLGIFALFLRASFLVGALAAGAVLWFLFMTEFMDLIFAYPKALGTVFIIAIPLLAWQAVVMFRDHCRNHKRQLEKQRHKKEMSP